MATIKFATGIPQTVVAERFDVGRLREYLARVEARGFVSAWTQEQLLGDHPRLSALETMTFAAACTSTLRLGCSVFVTPLHNPIQLAKIISSASSYTRTSWAR